MLVLKMLALEIYAHIVRGQKNMICFLTVREKILLAYIIWVGTPIFLLSLTLSVVNRKLPHAAIEILNVSHYQPICTEFDYIRNYRKYL